MSTNESKSYSNLRLHDDDGGIETSAHSPPKQPDLTAGIELIRKTVQQQLDIFNEQYISPSKQVIEIFSADFRRLEQEKQAVIKENESLKQYNSLLKDKLQEQVDDMQNMSNVSIIRKWEKKNTEDTG